MKLSKELLILLLCCSLVRLTAQAEAFGPTGQSNEQQPPPTVQHSPQELQQLVAPIALYPDALVAQILAASTYPAEIVEADRWIESHSNLKGEELAKEVDAQPWDPSVKALAQFPSVLANMDKNLSWTSALGDAYVNHQQDVMDAIQVMRRRAQEAGHLNTTPQQKVVEQGSQIVVEPANPEIVYVPQYDPWLVYGAPVVAWPGWYPYPGLFIAEPGIAFGVGFGLGFFGGFGWGWGHWGCDWGHRTVVFNHNTFVSRSRTFINRQTFARERANFGHAGGAHSLGSFRGPGDARAPGGLAHGGQTHTLGSDHGPGGVRAPPGSRSTAGSGGRAPHAFST